MGLKVGEVKLEKWNPQWLADFAHEKRNLQRFFGDLALSIQHVGSTSVEGLSAKPIIDIAVGVETLLDFEKVRARFAVLPDYSIKEDNAPDEILIRKGPEENRTCFIHVMEQNGTRMQQTLLFRNILRNNSSIRRDYENLKISLAQKFPHDREKYTAAKSDFIQTVSKISKI